MAVTTVLQEPNAQGKRRRSTEGAEGTNKGQDNGEALALVGVRLTAQLGCGQMTKRLSYSFIGMRCESASDDRSSCRGSLY